MFNTHRLVDRKWFHVLLWGGFAGYLVILATLGIFWPTDVVGGLITWGVMIPYLVAGPNGMAIQQPQIATPAAPPKTLAPVSCWRPEFGNQSSDQPFARCDEGRSCSSCSLTVGWLDRTYWHTYRKRYEKLHRAYLGKAKELALERLNALGIVADFMADHANIYYPDK